MEFVAWKSDSENCDCLMLGIHGVNAIYARNSIWGKAEVHGSIKGLLHGRDVLLFDL